MTLKTMILLMASALFWLGCGVDDEPRRPRVAQKSQAIDLSSMSIEERLEATAPMDDLAPGFFKWQEGQPGERDVSADMATCRGSAVQRDEYVQGNGIVQIAILSKCMSELGWELDREGVEAYRRSQAGL